MDDIRIRLAKKADFQDVLEMSEGIYSGHDYLPFVFLHWLDDPNRTILLAERDNKAVGLRVIFTVDEGSTVIYESLRVHVNFRRQGIGKRLVQASQQYVQEHFPEVKIQRCTVMSLSVERLAQIQNEPGNSLFLKLGALPVYVNPSELATEISRYANIKQTQQTLNKLTKLDRLSLVEFEAALTQGKLGRFLYSNDTMFVNWTLFKALPSNIPKGLAKQNDCILASLNAEAVESLSHCRRSEGVKCPQWCATFYTMEKKLLQVHIIKQLENAILQDPEKQFLFACILDTSMIHDASQLLDELLLENADDFTQSHKYRIWCMCRTFPEANYCVIFVVTFVRSPLLRLHIYKEEAIQDFRSSRNKMWFYFMAHVAYHLTRWFPKDDRKRIRIALILFSLTFLIPQLYVMMLDTSTRYCDEPLLEIAVASLIFTIAMIAFTFLFAIMEPVPWQLKIAFHFFGFAAFLMGLVQFGSTMTSTDCWFNTPELYAISLSFSIMAILSTGFLLLMLPFWLVNYFFPHSVLSRKERRGMCYEPVKCCTCLWHI